jgi:hypothetical protein
MADHQDDIPSMRDCPVVSFSRTPLALSTGKTGSGSVPDA